MLHFSNLDEILKFFNQKMTLKVFVFPKLRTVKTWLEKCLKSPVLEDPLTSNMVNVPKLIQMQLSQNQETFSTFFAAVFKSRLSFKDFESKGDRHRFCIFEVTDSKNLVRSISKKSHFRECFDRQYGKLPLHC